MEFFIKLSWNQVIILAANEFIPSGSGATIRHDTQNYSDNNRHATHSEYKPDIS